MRAELYYLLLSGKSLYGGNNYCRLLMGVCQCMSLML
jgi:hypothetical protein